MRTKCRDCGTSDYEVSRRGRDDVCDSCFTTRCELVAGGIVPLGGPDFLRIQRAMAGGRGTAKRLIDKLRSEADE